MGLFDEAKIPTTDNEWEALIAAWISAQESGKRKSDDDPAWWAVGDVSAWHLSDRHEAVWDFIIRTFEREMSDKAFAIIAAGPLEDLLADFGELYIERVEELARKNPRFNYLLGGVWRNDASDDVWD